MNLDLSFEVVTKTTNMANSGQYTGGCSGSRSDCCTRTCTNCASNSSDADA